VLFNFKHKVPTVEIAISAKMGVAWSQVFPPAATFTGDNIANQEGRVFIVTGGYAGIGFHVSDLLYKAGGTVYIAGRSEDRANAAIETIRKASPSSKGGLRFLELHLHDLTSIGSTVSRFQAEQDKLHVLFNNAGVSLLPIGSKSVQGHELHMATNCLGPLLLTKLLLPQLKAAAAATAQEPGSLSGSVRVIWTSSQVVELAAPKGGMVYSDLIDPPRDSSQNYTNSKTGNWYLASEFARRVGTENGILSLTTNPGALKTELLRHTSGFFRFMLSPLLYPPVYGAYTELYAGLSKDLTLEANGGAYIIPWGRLHPGMRENLMDGLKTREEGGSGLAKKFWDWCEEQVNEYR
jgi:NAD(P)-dependent dehydrogenase (short-subunit alcohol dehydrogenase family)